MLIGTVEAVIGPLFLIKLIFSFAIAPSTVSNAGHLHAPTAVITISHAIVQGRRRLYSAAFASARFGLRVEEFVAQRVRDRLF